MNISNNHKVALIIGITGQDGSYLTELLLSKNYKVHGIIRRSSSFNTKRIDHLYTDENLTLHYGDLSDTSCLINIISNVKPNEIYNLGAQSHVKVSFEMPEYTSNIDGLGTLRLLEAIKICNMEKVVKFYQASTSEMFGKVQTIPQNEQTPFYPRSPYGIAKLFAHWTVVNYRESYGIFGCNGILFNHESPRRGETFVTKKITKAVANIKLGNQECLYLGNLDALRDWGCARDYVYGMWLMLQQDKPDDYVLATGQTNSVRKFVEKAFSCVDIDIEWRGEGINEVGFDKMSGKILVRVDPKYYRPAEVDLLIGDARKAEKVLGWKAKTTFDELVKEMVMYDYEELIHKEII